MPLFYVFYNDKELQYCAFSFDKYFYCNKTYMKIQLDVMGTSSSVSSHHIKYLCKVNEGENVFSVERF